MPKLALNRSACERGSADFAAGGDQLEALTGPRDFEGTGGDLAFGGADGFGGSVEPLEAGGVSRAADQRVERDLT